MISLSIIIATFIFLQVYPKYVRKMLMRKIIVLITQPCDAFLKAPEGTGLENSDIKLYNTQSSRFMSNQFYIKYIPET